LGQARDGSNQNRAQYKAHNADTGKDKALLSGQAFAFGIVEKLGELLVYFDYRQKPGEACAQAPEQPMIAIAHALYGSR
jgi:hypothetical protein